MSDLLSSLNEEQRTAVTLPDASALILAGAGSGKTRVLTTRIAWLIQNGRVSPSGVLAVTFTNKAAREMAARLGAMLPINVRGMWIGTFHGLCNRMLRVHYRDAGLPQTFQILDMADQLSALKRLLKSLNLDSEKYPPKQLQHFINQAKEQGLRPADVTVEDDFQQRLVDLYAAYEAQCQREGVVDFAELLLRCYELLERDELRLHYQERFRHLLVDEFQDTNQLQYAWLKRLTGERTAVFAVGDDDQSIYAFRGANVNHMLDFERSFNLSKVIRLEQNYRSHAHILEAANQLIAHNTRRLGKNLRTDAGCGEPVRVYQAASDAQEASWIIEEINALLHQGVERDQIALLYRSNAQSRILEHTLVGAGIPYRVYGGLRFFERQEVKHALAYLRLIDNPNDDTALVRVVNFPARGIGARSLEQLADLARTHNCSLAEAVPYVSGKAGTNLGGFLGLLEKMRVETQHFNLPQTVEYVTRASGLIDYYLTEREGQDRIDNLHELMNAATAFVNEAGYGLTTPARMLPSHRVAAPVLTQAEMAVEVDTALQQGIDEMTPLAAFLSHASLEAGDNQAQAGQAAVQLMTVHAAKGLEFNAVFITGLEEGLFPHENSIADLQSLEEERRLMYVAITRARQRLYLSFAQSRMLHGQTRYGMRSRFLEELPEGVLKWLTPTAKSADFNYGWEHTRNAFVDTVSSYSSTKQQTDGGFRLGQSVFHTKFGEGVILQLEGQGAEGRARVKFGRHGEKWLALAVAKLQVIDA